MIWRKPPITTPQAIPAIGLNPYFGAIKDRIIPEIIEPRLKKLEVSAGIKNFPKVFNIPIAMAESETSIRKGNIIEVMSVVSSSLPGIVA